MVCSLPLDKMPRILKPSLAYTIFFYIAMKGFVEGCRRFLYFCVSLQRTDVFLPFPLGKKERKTEDEPFLRRSRFLLPVLAKQAANKRLFREAALW
ncbi:MAG: hypothetical protein MRZ54_06905 [Clostridiales bacterium]|nr:hypothetical protein [Clostridiales bacterium]